MKQEIRVLGIDDGKFVSHTKGKVLIVGVVFRGGYSIDGVMHTRITIDGLDATEKLALMINNSPHHKQLRLVMLNGITFGGFNVVDIQKLCFATKLPVLALTGDKPNLNGIHEAIKNLPNAEERWGIILEAGKIHEIINKGVPLYGEIAGISLDDAERIIALTSIRSSLPEPLRVAHLVASGVSS
ncbi:DUF99 family protein [Candidatus Bathyarchaeota archaeon]|nr:MAG: DUF99 family protein [Candidatus Bathyarchaeota archaeon]